MGEDKEKRNLTEGLQSSFAKAGSKWNARAKPFHHRGIKQKPIPFQMRPDPKARTFKKAFFHLREKENFFKRRRERRDPLKRDCEDPKTVKPVRNLIGTRNQLRKSRRKEGKAKSGLRKTCEKKGKKRWMFQSENGGEWKKRRAVKSKIPRIFKMWAREDRVAFQKQEDLRPEVEIVRRRNCKKAAPERSEAQH